MKLRDMLANVSRRLDVLFPGYFADAKHDHYKDFSWPTQVTFDNLLNMYRRNGIAKGAVSKTVLKTWQDYPFLLEKARDGSQGGKSQETAVEADVRKHFEAIRFWQNVAETDRRSLVGRYAGLILRFGDNKKFAEPVDIVPGGLAGLVEVVPAWQGQLEVATWGANEANPDTYGKPTMYRFNEVVVADNKQVTRQFDVHPDRVVIWSTDGSVHGTSLLEAGFNDLIDLEKIKGAGGEGFWKNAKSAPVLNVDKEARIDELARMLGVPVTQIADKMGEQVEDWQKGFDKLLMLQGIKAETLSVSLPSPEHFWAAPLQSFAASVPIPLKILVGSQTGERASTEDANEWNQTIMSRRANICVPTLMELVNRLVRFRVLKEADWIIDWSDLTEASMSDKIARADKMADVNQKMKDSGELIFTPEEMREVVDLEPLSDAEKYRDNPQDAAAALGADPTGVV